MNVFQQNMLEQLEVRPGTSLVLSGGATKAFYFHLGVLKALHIHNISSIIGSSAGAVIGAMIASGISVETLTEGVFQERLYLPEFNEWIKSMTSGMLFRPNMSNIMHQGVLTGLAGFRFLASLPLLVGKDVIAEAFDAVINSQSQVSSFFSAAALEHMMDGLIASDSFADLDIDLYVTATDIDSTRRAVFNANYEGICEHNRFFNDVSVHKAVRASISLPGLFEPVKIHGRYYVDGEIKRTLSADIGAHLADTVIISHTYQPLSRPGNRSMKDLGWWNLVKQSIYIVFYERIRVWEEIYKERFPQKRFLTILPEPDDEFFFRAPQFTFKPEVQKALMHSGEVAARHALQRFEEEYDRVPAF